jgi:hypothetical protein
VCGIVTSNIPYSCKRNQPGVLTASAVQIDQRGTKNDNDDICYVAGKYDESSIDLKLLSEDDPTKGMVLTYYGDNCKSSQAQRKFMINMICADKLTAIPTHALEYKPCEYSVTVPSVYGCPIECPVTNRKLCAGNGHCSYDNDNGSGKCFCNQGFYLKN